MKNLDVKKVGGITVLAVLVLFVVFSGTAPSPGEGSQSAAAVASYSYSENALDWVIKSVCVDSINRPVPADPYYDCPGGTTRRKIQLGDPLPYYNFDQDGGQRSDAYPVLDANNNPLYFQTFDWAPFNEYNLFDGSDGYDFYSLKDGWFSAPGTRDGGGYGIQFYGGNCAYGDGWVFFPLTGFFDAGEVQQAISGQTWEQNGFSYPGPCPNPTHYEYPVTKWGLEKNVSFGGVDGNPVKTMDAIIAYHGFEPNKPSGMEVFYFTEQYGKTRWESWIPASRNPTKTDNCVVPDTTTYLGETMIVADCRDWTNVKLATESSIPKWPLASANLLQHSHFDDEGGYTLATQDGTVGLWHRGGNSVEGSIINLSLYNSRSAADIGVSQNGAGVRYLATNCAGTCTGPGVQEIFQEVNIDRFVDGGTYLFGANARTARGQGSGTLRITLQELDSNNNVLWQDHVEGVVSPYNGTSDNNSRFTDSVYLSSSFIHKTTVIPIHPGAKKIRYYITPITSQTFDIVQAWLNPFPEMTNQLGSVGTPSVALDANGQSSLSIYAGDNYALNWNSSNVEGCTVAYSREDGYEPKTGNFTVAPNALGSGTSGLIGLYVITCIGDTQNVSDEVKITEIPTSPPTISADPATVSSGGRATLSWSAPAGSSCVYSSPTNSPTDAPYGTYGATGAIGVGPLNEDATYTITCGGKSSSATVKVTPTVVTPAESFTITASPSPCTILSGKTTCTSTISWTAPQDIVTQVWVDTPTSAPEFFACKTSPQTLSQSASWITETGDTFYLYQTTSCNSSAITGLTEKASVRVVGTAGTSPTPPPTATLTAAVGAGAPLTDITINVGDTVKYAWSSTNGDSSAATYTIDSPACGLPASGAAAWISGLSGGGSVTFNTCDEGHTYTFKYTVTGSGGQTATATLTVRVRAAPATPACGILRSGASLTPGQQVFSCNGLYQLILQTDGNLVLYDSTGKALWSTGTVGMSATTLRMQEDGNLVLYKSGPEINDNALWASGSTPPTRKSGGGIFGKAGYLAVQDDGNLVVYASADGSVLWASNTAKVAAVNAYANQRSQLASILEALRAALMQITQMLSGVGR